MLMRALTIQKAALDQAPVILTILEDARHRLASRNIFQWQNPFERSFISPALERGEFFLASVDNRVAGVFRLLWADPEIWGDTTDAAYLHTLAVHRDFSGRGLGYKVLKWCETAAAQRGCRYLRLDCASFNSALRLYYINYGFTLRGEKSFKTFHVALFEKAIQPASS
jgi:GNAT superfamily N-acetyltransferase